jgi:hypothetical protein
MWESGQWWMIFLTAHGSENLFINLLAGSKIEHNAILCAEFFYLMQAPRTQENYTGLSLVFYFQALMGYLRNAVD